MNKRAIVISGPSSVGKSTICNELLKINGIWKSVSTTTRQKRNDEKDGFHYYFISIDEFKKKIVNNEFLEYAEIFGNYYGTLREPVEDAFKKNNIVLFEIDYQGARNIRKEKYDMISFFIIPPNLEELKRRMLERRTETNKSFQVRIARLEEETKTSDEYDYKIINDDLNRAVDEIKRHIMRKFSLRIL